LFALARLFGETALWMAWLAGGLALGGLLVKLGYWRAIDNAKSATTAETATALGAHGAVRLLDPPHTEENFVQDEMGYRVARKHARRFRDVAVAAGFLGPLALIALGESLSGWPGALAAMLAALLAIAGVLIERWLFFAEARHTVALYYGAREV
jgi:DMSO reductase anchor subunit